MNFGFKAKPAKPQDQPRILITNCFQDEDFARKLAFALRRDRVSPFVAVGEMTAGDSLIRRLTSATQPRVRARSASGDGGKGSSQMSRFR